MDELAEQINFVMSHFALKNIIGFGVGAGSNVLARFALTHPEKVCMCHEQLQVPGVTYDISLL
jgi:pimeloyl-ACP methyl ester carboxylesterase